MWFVYNFLMLVQFISHRYMRHKWKLAIKIHVATAFTMMVFSALGFYFMFVYLDNTVLFLEKGIIHVALGFSSLLSLLVNIGLGMKAYFHRTNP